MENIAQNMVNEWASDIRGSDEKFIRAVVYALDQFGQKNNAPLYNLIAICNGKVYAGQGSIRGLSGGANGKLPRLTQFATPLKRVLDSAATGFTFKYKDGKVSVTVKKDAAIDVSKVEALRMLCAKGADGRYISPRSVEFAKIFPAPEKTEKPKKSAQEVQEQLAKYLAKLASDSGFDLAVIQAMATAKPSKRDDDDAGIAH